MDCTHCKALTLISCPECGTPVCGSCRAPSTSDALAPAFASYCSIDCRDGGLVLAEFSMVDCPECEGTGIWRKGAFGNDRECFSCRATGKITPAKRKSLLERADTPRAKRAAKFGP